MTREQAYKNLLERHTDGCDVCRQANETSLLRAPCLVGKAWLELLGDAVEQTKRLSKEAAITAHGMPWSKGMTTHDDMPSPPFPAPENEVLKSIVTEAIETYQAGITTAEQAITHAAIHAWYEGHILGEDTCPGCDYRGNLPKQELRGWIPPGTTTS